MITSLDIHSYISSRIEMINRQLELLVKECSCLQNELYIAARYSLLSSGKRLRPLLVLATVDTFGAPLEKALYPACALEMVHTYSLIHDDLPCMDDDDLRRGKPTLHKVFPEGHAVLTGDYLLTYAFEVLTKSPELSSDQKIELVKCLSYHSGSQGMIGGQVADLASSGKKISKDVLYFIHLHKTASLLMAAFEFGGIISDAREEDRLLLTSAGKNLGLAFQIIDDILDATGTEEELGKKPGSDSMNEKPTAVSIFGIEEAQKEAEKLFSEAIDSLSLLSKDSHILQSLASSLVFRKK